MRILDIDMDFFLNEIRLGRENDSDRLDDDTYIPWDEQCFRNFLEQQCLLSKNNRIAGRVVTHHDEAFHFWKELMNSGNLAKPFEVTHIDAHSDTGLGDRHWLYIMEELVHYPIEQREKILDNEDKVNLANYLAFSMACGWISKVDFVLHPEWENDIAWMHLKNYDDNAGAFQFKEYDKSAGISQKVERLHRIPPTRLDLEVPYSLIQCADFKASEPFDYVVFCQSPGYTPKSADYMLEVIREYIKEI